MKKQFEDFQKMKIKDACKAIEDMTFSFINPTTNQPTYVPAKHYENILSKTVEQFLDEQLKVEMLNNVYKQVVFLQQEYGKDFMKSLICIDLGIKPTDLSLAETIALDETYATVEKNQKEQKKNFTFLRKEITDKYNESLENSQLQVSYLKGNNIGNEQQQAITEDDIDMEM